MREWTKAAVPDLVRAAGGTDHAGRRNALGALADLGRPSEPALSAATHGLGDAVPAVRVEAARALENVGRGGREALSALGRAVTLVALAGVSVLAADPGYRAEQAGLPPSFPSSGVVLLGWVPPGEFGSESKDPVEHAFDCWGYTSPRAREYAMVSISRGTAFVEVTDPDNPQIVAVFTDPRQDPSAPRDVKAYRHYAYSVADKEGVGIEVFDLGEIDAGRVALVNTVTEGGTHDSLDTHNIAINEESGFLYRCAGDRDAVGFRIYDLETPSAPRFVAEWHDRYIHDAQVVTYTTGPFAGREVAFCFTNRPDARIDIVDVTDKSAIGMISTVHYSNAAFSHQGWLSSDRRYLYAGDELDETRFDLPTTTRIIDVLDLDNPFEAGTFTNGQSAVDHNLYVAGNRLYEANYDSGLRVFDVNDPLVPVETAWFDTHPEDPGETTGLWTAYPFFESGIVIGSDIERGLFVWWVGDPLLAFDHPEGRPRLIGAAGHRLPVEISDNGDAIVPGSAELHYALGEKLVSVDLLDLGAGAFEAVFPPLKPASRVRYYLSVESTRGITWRDPPDAAETVRVAFPDECGLEPRPGDCRVWEGAGIGFTEFPGGFRLESHCLQVVAGAGGGFTGGPAGDEPDRLHFAYRAISADFRLTAEIQEWTAESVGSQIGLMVRDSLEATARHGSIALERKSDGFEHIFASRKGKAEPPQTLHRDAYDHPRLWLRLEREGGVIRGMLSEDRESWTPPDTVVLGDLPSELLVGVASADPATDGGEKASLGTACNIALAPRPEFRRGDCNGDGNVDISDAICTLEWLFIGSARPGCIAALNTNGDETVNIADPVYSLWFSFLAGPPPVAPFPECGVDTLPSDETMGCETPPKSCEQ